MTIQTLLLAAERYDKLGEQDKAQALLDRADERLLRSQGQLRYPYAKYDGLVREGFKLVKDMPVKEAIPKEKASVKKSKR